MVWGAERRLWAFLISCLHAAARLARHARRGQWEKVGDVVGGPGEGSGDTLGVGGKWHAGRQWDFVVDVDFADGVPPKKLAFDRADNPYTTAERCAEMLALAPKPGL